MTTAFGLWLQEFKKKYFPRKTVTLNKVESSKTQNDHQRTNTHQSNH